VSFGLKLYSTKTVFPLEIPGNLTFKSPPGAYAYALLLSLSGKLTLKGNRCVEAKDPLVSRTVDRHLEYLPWVDIGIVIELVGLPDREDLLPYILRYEHMTGGDLPHGIACLHMDGNIRDLLTVARPTGGEHITDNRYSQQDHQY